MQPGQPNCDLECAARRKDLCPGRGDTQIALEPSRKGWDSSLQFSADLPGKSLSAALPYGSTGGMQVELGPGAPFWVSVGNLFHLFSLV